MQSESEALAGSAISGIEAETASYQAKVPVRARYIPALDGLRGAAVLVVVVYHYGGGATSGNVALRLIGNVIKFGWSGVTLFFLLSGFLITGILWDSKGESHWWRNFYARRALRIFPLYYGTLLAVLLLALHAGGPNVRNVWVPMLYLQNFPQLYPLMTRIPAPLAMYHYWSLAVEEQFYLVWPFLLLWVKRPRQAAWMCLAVFAVSFGARVLMQRLLADAGAYGQSLLARGGELALGGWLAIAYRSRWWERLDRFTGPVALVSAVVAAVGAWMNGGPELSGKWGLTVTLPAITLCYAAILAMAVRPEGLTVRVANVRWLRWVGGISFGVYIFHVLLVAQFTHLAELVVPPDHRNAFLAVRFLIGVGGSLLVAWVSFNFYEKPFLRLKRRFPTRTHGTAA